VIWVNKVMWRMDQHSASIYEIPDWQSTDIDGYKGGEEGVGEGK